MTSLSRCARVWHSICYSQSTGWSKKVNQRSHPLRMQMFVSSTQKFTMRNSSLATILAFSGDKGLGYLPYVVGGLLAVGMGNVYGNETYARDQVNVVDTPMRLQNRKWEIHHELGSGAYGVVKLAKCKETGEIAAAKVLDMTRLEKGALRREIDALRRIKSLGGHENIIDLMDITVNAEGSPCLVTEFVAGGELFDHLVKNGAYSEKGARSVMAGIGKALQFMHVNGLIHNDLKPENLLLCDEASTVKIADFGSSGPASAKTSDSLGTTAYWSPELIGNGEVSSAADMWAVGCILYIILSGRHPFDLEGTASDAEVTQKILEGKVSFEHPLWSRISPEAKDMISKLLTHNPKSRMTAEELLSHQWMKSA